MFTDRLGLGRPQDISARMDLIDSSGEVVYEKDENGKDISDGAGWLEFWGPEADQVKKFGRHVAAEELLEEKREQRRKTKKEPTIAEMERKVEGFEQKATEALAIRLKDWRLIDKDGRVMDDVQPTKESAEQLFGHPEYAYLKLAALEFIGEPSNFFTKKPGSSSPSQETSSEAS